MEEEIKLMKKYRRITYISLATAVATTGMLIYSTLTRPSTAEEITDCMVQCGKALMDQAVSIGEQCMASNSSLDEQCQSNYTLLAEKCRLAFEEHRAQTKNTIEEKFKAALRKSRNFGRAEANRVLSRFKKKDKRLKACYDLLEKRTKRLKECLKYNKRAKR